MNKIIHVNNPGQMTRSQEFAIMDAFERYEGEVEIKVPQRDHLGSKFRKGVSCDHKWTPAPMQDDVSVWFQKNFEETDANPGSYCSVCGATCLREDGKIWAYDGTTRFFGKVPKERHNASSQKNERKTR